MVVLSRRRRRQTLGVKLCSVSFVKHVLRKYFNNSPHPSGFGCCNGFHSPLLKIAREFSCKLESVTTVIAIMKLYTGKL